MVRSDDSVLAWNFRLPHLLEHAACVACGCADADEVAVWINSVQCYFNASRVRRHWLLHMQVLHPILHTGISDCWRALLSWRLISNRAFYHYASSLY